MTWAAGSVDAANESAPDEPADGVGGNIVPYDTARHHGSVLSALLLERLEAAADAVERSHWAARRGLVKQQLRALDPDDQRHLAAQHQAWADETHGLLYRGINPHP